MNPTQSLFATLLLTLLVLLAIEIAVLDVTLWM